MALAKHQHGDGARAQHSAGGAANDQRANARVAIGAHDQQIHGLCFNIRGNHLFGVALLQMGFYGKAILRQLGRCIGQQRAIFLTICTYPQKMAL